MAHFAHITNGIVDQVLVAEQAFIDIQENPEDWVQTSYNTRGGVHALGGTPLRKNYAGVGFTYDHGRDAFIPPRPADPENGTYHLNEDTCLWELVVDNGAA